MITTAMPLPDDTLLTEYFEKRYAPLRLRGKSLSNLRLYAGTLRSFDRRLGRPARLSDLTDDALADFMGWRLENGLAAASVNGERNRLCALWRFAARKRDVEQWPDVELLNEPVRIPLAWSKEQLSALFAACRAQRGHIAGVPAGLWWTALHFALWFTGERIGCAMRWRWDHLSGNWLSAPAEIRKGKREDRLYELPADAVAAIEAIRNPRRELIFPWEKNPTYIWLAYKSVLRRAGLPTDRKSKFHRMRKSHASYVKLAGLNPTEALGHADAKTTRAYLDPRICGQTNAGGALWTPRLDPASGQDRSLFDLVAEFNQREDRPNREACRKQKWILTSTFSGCQMQHVRDLDGGVIFDYADRRSTPRMVAEYRMTTKRFVRWIIDTRQIAGAAADCLTLMEAADGRHKNGIADNFKGGAA